MPELFQSDAIKVGIGIIVFLSIATQAVVAPIFDGNTQFDDSEVVDGDATLQTGVGRFVAEVFWVRATLEDAVELTGANDSEVSVTGSLSLGPEWSVCTYAMANQSVVDNNETRQIVGFNDVVVSYNGTDDVYRTWFFNATNREDYSANISAPTPTEDTLICGWHNVTHLRTTRNTTVGTATETTGEFDDIEPKKQNWNGTIEETRIYDRALSDAARQSYVDEPNVGVPGDQPPKIRITYDVLNRNTNSVNAYFSAESATLSNATLVDGFRGPELVRGDDFKMFGKQVVVTENSVLDGDGDVVYAEYRVRFDHGNLIAVGIALFALGVITNRIIAMVTEIGV